MNITIIIIIFHCFFFFFLFFFHPSPRWSNESLVMPSDVLLT
jgi:hypothetical protein